MPSNSGLSRVKAIFEKQGAARWRVALGTARERKAKLRRLKTALARGRAEMARAVQQDFGKHPFEFEITEISPVLGEINHALRHLETWMRPQPVGTPFVLFGTSSEIRWEPKGRALILSPWNYPLFLLLTPLVSAVAAGDCVMIRPSAKVPRLSKVLARIIGECFNEDEVAVVQGGHEVGDALLKLPFDHIFFTGSTAVGVKVMAAASRHLSSLTLELGGKSPAIVDESADIPWAARAIAWGKFVNAGQTCVAPDFVYVQSGVAGRLAAELRRALEEFYGPEKAGREGLPDYCRIIDHNSYARLKDTLNATLTAGARLEAGGGMDQKHRYIAPTVLSNVKPGMPVMRAEIFGPLLPLMSYENLDEVFNYLRGQPKPLALYIFSRDHGQTEKILSNTTAGGTVVNNTLKHLANPNLPFGGVGASGMGSYHGFFGFQAFSHVRAVLTQKRPRLAGFFKPPYQGRLKQGVLAFLKLWG